VCVSIAPFNVNKDSLSQWTAALRTETLYTQFRKSLAADYTPKMTSFAKFITNPHMGANG